MSCLPCLGSGFISSTDRLYGVSRWSVFRSGETPWPQARGVRTPRAAGPSAQGPLAFQLSARFSFPLCILQAAQPFRNPSEKPLWSPLCLSSDQVLESWLRNEKQLSLLQGSGGPEATEGENHETWGHILSSLTAACTHGSCPVPSTPNLALWVCLPEMTAPGRISEAFLQERLGNTGPGSGAALLSFPLCPVSGGGCSEKRLERS